MITSMQGHSESFASIEVASTNLGDDIQILAALQFLPDEVTFLDRDRIGRAQLQKPAKIILNGWYMQSPAAWPPPRDLQPLIISFHAKPKLFAEAWRLEYLRDQSERRPLGARDLDTLALFERAGISAYWSGCLTLTLRPQIERPRTDNVVAVDIDEQCLHHLAHVTKCSVISGTQLLSSKSRRSMRWRLFERHRFNRAKRFSLAKQRLLEIATAHCVVTSRLHVALPCLSMGTPVLFVTNRPSDPRLASWLRHLHWVDQAEFLAGRYSYSFDYPPQNDTKWQKLAASLRATCEDFTRLTHRSFEEVG